jgi:hypothetical protein
LGLPQPGFAATLTATDDGAFCVSLGRCCAIILTPSFKRFLTRCTAKRITAVRKEHDFTEGCS